MVRVAPPHATPRCCRHRRHFHFHFLPTRPGPPPPLRPPPRSDDEKGKLQEVLDENIEARDTEAHVVPEDDLRELEPSLSQRAKGAVLCPREAVVEPFLVGIG